jgi:hypothetical protein
MTRNTWTIAVTLAGMLCVSADAFANGVASSVRSGVSGDGRMNMDRSAPTVDQAALQPRAPRLVSRTVSPGSGRQEVLFSVPNNSQLLITRACVQHTAMVIQVGDDKDRLSFGPRGCTDYMPGFVVAGGENIYCDNGSGLERTCALVGILESVPMQAGPRVRFHNLRR